MSFAKQLYVLSGKIRQVLRTGILTLPKYTFFSANAAGPPSSVNSDPDLIISD